MEFNGFINGTTKTLPMGERQRRFAPSEFYIVLTWESIQIAVDLSMLWSHLGCNAIFTMLCDLTGFLKALSFLGFFFFFFLGKKCHVSLSFLSCERNTFVGHGSVLKWFFANSFAFSTNKSITQEVLLQQSRRNIIKADLKIEFLCHYKG